MNIYRTVLFLSVLSCVGCNLDSYTVDDSYFRLGEVKEFIIVRNDYTLEPESYLIKDISYSEAPKLKRVRIVKQLTERVNGKFYIRQNPIKHIYIDDGNGLRRYVGRGDDWWTAYDKDSGIIEMSGGYGPAIEQYLIQNYNMDFQDAWIFSNEIYQDLTDYNLHPYFIEQKNRLFIFYKIFPI